MWPRTVRETGGSQLPTACSDSAACRESPIWLEDLRRPSTPSATDFPGLPWCPIFEDSARNIWLSTVGKRNGLANLDRRDGTIHSYSDRLPWLPTSGVSLFAEDGSGQLWLGILRFGMGQPELARLRGVLFRACGSQHRCIFGRNSSASPRSAKAALGRHGPERPHAIRPSRQRSTGDDTVHIGQRPFERCRPFFDRRYSGPHLRRQWQRCGLLGCRERKGKEIHERGRFGVRRGLCQLSGSPRRALVRHCRGPFPSCAFARRPAGAAAGRNRLAAGWRRSSGSFRTRRNRDFRTALPVRSERCRSGFRRPGICLRGDTALPVHAGGG